MMEEPAMPADDLEDGEIESDGEEAPAEKQSEINNEVAQPISDEKSPREKNDSEKYYYTKSGKRKKNKNYKSEQKSKDRSKRKRRSASPQDEDFAGSIEKAIRKAMNKDDTNETHEDDYEPRRKSKKRKKVDGKEGSSKKRNKEYADEVDESEMMCVRGASPVVRDSPIEENQENDRDSYSSDSSQGSRINSNNGRSQRQRNTQRDRKKNDRDRRRGAHPLQDPDGVCLYFMQGKCHKGDECMYSHNAEPPRKMELCKFYLMECCAKRDKCLYMHSDFPCKYYHTGLPCIYKDECKFAHGGPLKDALKNILIKHIESAPKEILGDFPRLNREGALKMIHSTQQKLMQQFGHEIEVPGNNIPSLFDLNIPKPQGVSDININNILNSDKQNKVRHSRWHNENSTSNMNSNGNFPLGMPGDNDVLSIKNLTGVLTPRQISDLTKMGIENLGQLGQLTVLQLNSIGISLAQITEIQLNTVNIQKLGFINTDNDKIPKHFLPMAPKDLDLRVPPAMAMSSVNVKPTELPEKDIDMRFQSARNMPIKTETKVPTNNVVPKSEDRKNTNTMQKDMIDIDQYTKDALKFATKEKENIDVLSGNFETQKANPENLISKDVDHRVLPFSNNETPILQYSDIKEGDTDIRFLQPEPVFKSPEKRNRRYTTDDDEESNLLIDEKYSSDEEKCAKKKSPISSPMMSPTQTIAPPVIQPTEVLKKLGDLSKIDISEEVTKLLNKMKNNTNEICNDSSSEDMHKARDPRTKTIASDSKIDSDKFSHEKLDITKPSTRKVPRVSIYECIDGEPTDGRRRTDVDLRQTDYKLPTFGDTDLRQSSSGDIDFRLGLPFKAIPNYTPASEIDGSINSHPPIPYKVVPIDIPRPDYTDIRNSVAKSQAILDPRLRKVFRLSVDESNSDSEKPKPSPATTPRLDPRRKPKESPADQNILDNKPPSLDLQIVIQNSDWYKELSSNQKIFVNQQIASVTSMIKQFQQEKVSGKPLDLTQIQNNSILINIFNNLGVTLGENGEFSYTPKPKEALLKTPANYSQNSNMFQNSNAIESNNLNMMNVSGMGGPMNNIPMGGMPGFNNPFPDPRGGPAPGLLGIAPNIPHNFNNNFPGPNNFGNMPFNGPGSDFGNMDGDPNYHRFPNRGGPRGRGNDRWNRGGGARGHRERKNFSDRGKWKN